MKKILIIVFNIYLLGSVNAQTGFYFKPVFEWKWNSGSYYNQSYTINTSNGHSIKIEPITNFRTKTLALGLGYQSKRFFCETGLSLDGGSSGMRISGESYYSVDSTYQQMWLTTTGGGVEYRKIPLRFGLKLFGKDSVKVGKKIYTNLFLFGGLDILLKPNKYSSDPVTETGVEFYDKNGTVTKTKVSYYETNFPFTVFKTLGLMAKFYNKKHRNMFNISMHYSLAPKHSFISEQRITITDPNGTKYRSSYVSNGSGFYITFSRDFYPLNWFK